MLLATNAASTKVMFSFLRRFLLIALAIGALDAAMSEVAAGHVSGQCTAAGQSSTAWGWRQRLGLFGLLGPLLANTAGLLWPFLDMAGYEQSFVQIHQVRPSPFGSV